MLSFNAFKRDGPLHRGMGFGSGRGAAEDVGGDEVMLDSGMTAGNTGGGTKPGGWTDGADVDDEDLIGGGWENSELADGRDDDEEAEFDCKGEETLREEVNDRALVKSSGRRLDDED